MSETDLNLTWSLAILLAEKRSEEKKNISTGQYCEIQGKLCVEREVAGNRFRDAARTPKEYL